RPMHEGETVPRTQVRKAQKYLEKLGYDPKYYLLEIKSSGVGYAPYSPGARHHKNIEIEMRDGTYREAAEVSEAIASLTKLKYQAVQYCFPEFDLNGRSIRKEMESFFTCA